MVQCLIMAEYVLSAIIHRFVESLVSFGCEMSNYMYSMNYVRTAFVRSIDDCAMGSTSFMHLK